MTTQIDQHYVLLPQFDYGGVFFYGFENNNLVYSQVTKTWKIIQDSKSVEEFLESDNSIEASKTVGTLQLDGDSNQMPIGTHYWNLTEKCSGIMKLKFTQVSMYSKLDFFKNLIYYFYVSV